MPPKAAKDARTSASKEQGDKDEKETTVACIGCGNQLRRDHTGIVCMNDHHICAEQGCALNFVNHIMGEGPAAIPVKCMNCHVDVVANSFERNVPVASQEAYAQTCILVGGNPMAGEHWHRCPFCPNMVILMDSEGELSFNCAGCKATSCMVCSAKVKSQRDFERHLLTCGLHGALKNEFVSIIGRASQGVCPGCGHMGQKDDACTHMTCPACHVRWCYVCEQTRADASGGEHEHNTGWEGNPARCPMYLHYIPRRNLSWPRDPRDCVGHFHRRRILHALQVKVANVGVERVREMLQLFPTALDGIPLDEILHAGPPRDF